MGRTVTFLARLVARRMDVIEGGAIAADRETALHVDPGTGHGGGAGHAHPHRRRSSTSCARPGPPEVCEPGMPLTYRNVEVYRIGPGGSFDLDALARPRGHRLHPDGGGGVLTSSRGEIY